jgi:hypothetical protein
LFNPVIFHLKEDTGSQRLLEISAGVSGPAESEFPLSMTRKNDFSVAVGLTEIDSAVVNDPVKNVSEGSLASRKRGLDGIDL